MSLSGSKMLDVQRLIGEVAAKNGIRLEPNDPAFALVTLNQLVLEETVSRLGENVSLMLAQFADSLNKTERRAGALLAQDAKNAAMEIKTLLRSEAQAGSGSALSAPHYKWASLGLLSGLLLFGIGAALGAFSAQP